MILVIGGRSKIGSALVGELIKRSEDVRALVRQSESGSSFPDGMQTMTGDLGDPRSLISAMEGIRQVFLLCGPSPDEVAFNRNAIDAAASADVALLVRSSILGADPGSPATFVRDHGACDRYLRDADVAHAIVRPNLFMQNVPETIAPSIDENGALYANVGDARISMVDTRDVAAVAAVLLTEPGHEGEEFDVTGPEALSYRDVADKLAAAMGSRVDYVDVPDDAVRAALAGYGMSDWMVGALVDLFEYYRRSGIDGDASLVTDTVERLTGVAPRSLDALLAEAPSARAGSGSAHG